MSGSLSGPTDILIAVAVVALVLVRQLRARRVAEGRSWWILPAVLVYLGLEQGGVLDSRHEAASAGLLAAEMVIGAGMGVLWALTTRIWRDEAGTAWMKGTKTTALAWAGGIALRIALAWLGSVMGVHEGRGALMLALAVTLLIRKGVVAWRVNGSPGALRAGAVR
ncbi:DUF1453 family protein [Streptomyces sp. SL13]|uniref:DUF1453 family protein n=1 Tax=Streptantibioticus silvisoli TaxID=2705255 RepID=A0AA90H419_9ACTN|nr:CcdC protein domain-containing protein [Streptantibioticus silvisoli]MDI5973029.1 DUF1453 family protein [Streptantibioticus silvisoli]